MSAFTEAMAARSAEHFEKAKVSVASQGIDDIPLGNYKGTVTVTADTIQKGKKKGAPVIEVNVALDGDQVGTTLSKGFVIEGEYEENNLAAACRMLKKIFPDSAEEIAESADLAEFADIVTDLAETEAYCEVSIQEFTPPGQKVARRFFKVLGPAEA